MDAWPDGGLRYHIFDPTGNITALVEGEIAVEMQPLVAMRIMERHPQVEQVGFVSNGGVADKSDVHATLRMAGGEFCGNASMCAAAWFALGDKETHDSQDQATVWLRVSGASQPVEIHLTKADDGAFQTSICMPKAQAIKMVVLAFEHLEGALPLVRMEGISHLVVAQSSAFASLAKAKKDAERAVRQWCDELGFDGLGMMFLDDGASEFCLTPLVYVPGSDTVFWENSCASGSVAVGMYLAAKAATPTSVTLHEPGGTLRVESDPDTARTWLYGSVRLMHEYG